MKLLSSLLSKFVERRERQRSASPSFGTQAMAEGEALEPRHLLTSVTMTANDQLLLELVNLARSNPAAEVQRWAGESLNDGLSPGTISNTPKQPLAPHQSLINAAVAHSQDMLAFDYFSHTGRNGSTPTNRANAAGYPNSVGENIAWAGSTGQINQVQHVYERHRALLDSEGHRRNLMTEWYDEAGTGIRYGVFTSGLNYNASMATQLFGSRHGNSFITGVAYSDLVVDDDFYTVGEGAGGILVTARNTANGQTYSVTTGPSGGYGLQVPDGTYTVVAMGGQINGEVTIGGVTVDGLNVKVDIITTEGTPPAQAVEVTTNGMGIVGRSGGVWWQATSTGVNLVNQNWGAWSNAVPWDDVQTADVNGDGRADVIGRTNGRWWVARSTGTEFVNEFWGAWSTRVGWQNVLVGDFNGDGRDDLIGRTEGGQWWVGRSTGSEFINEPWGAWSPRANWQHVQVGDFNGDGRDDILGRASSGGWWVAKSTGTGFEMEFWGAWSTAVNWTHIQTGDFNGDGRLDLMGRAGSAWWLAESTGASFVNRVWTGWSDRVVWENIRVGDVDGDGRDDLIGQTGGQWWVARTEGLAIVNERWGNWDPFARWDDILLLDVNRDGMVDLLARSGSDWWVGRSDGQQFQSAIWGRWPTSLSWDDVLPGHFG
jgi:hypothetical protein